MPRLSIRLQLPNGGRAELLHQIRITSKRSTYSLPSYRLQPRQVPYKNRRMSPEPVRIFLKFPSNFRHQESLHL
jgi:hypothetical protein